MSWSSIAQKKGKKKSKVISKSKKPKTSNYVKEKTDEWIPHPFQKKAVKFMLKRDAAGLFADPGLGKTSMTLATFKILKKKNLVDFMIVVAPLLVCDITWPDEVKKWKDFRYMTTLMLHGDNRKVAISQQDVDIFLINHEGLEWLHDNWPKEWNKKKIMFVGDESTRFKSWDSIRFKIMKGGKVTRHLQNKKTKKVEKMEKKFKSLLKKFTYRYILTGTPAPNGLLDLFCQIYLLDYGKRLGKFITHYKNNYFSPSGYGGFKVVPRAGAAEEIKDKIKDIIIRLDANDYLDMPPLIGDITGISGKRCNGDEGIIRLEMPDKIRKLYDELEEEFIIELDNQAITAMNAASSSTKLRQMANGGIYFNCQNCDDPLKTLKREFKQLHYIKAEMTKNLVDELSGQPVLIAYEFHHDLYRLKEVLGKKTPHIGAGVSKAEARALIKKWNRGELPVLIGQPASMSHGLNLQAYGRAIIWHSMIWNYEFYVQFVRRLYRQGQENTVFLYHLMMKDTVDTAVYYALRGKASTENTLLDALKEYFNSKR